MAGLPGPFNFLRPLGAVGGTAIGFAVGSGVAPAIRPVIQDLANQAWELHQVRPLEASIAAQLVAEGLWTEGQGQAEAARSGINDERFGALVAEARQGPTLEQAFEGVRRGIIDGARLTDAMRQAGVRPEWDELMRLLVEVLPSPTDMVRFAVREVYDPAQRAFLDLDAEFPAAFAADAERVGLSRETAGKYWAAHWDLPSFEQLTRMLHRGELTTAEFDLALRAIDVAPTWRAKLRSIARAIPGLQDMVRFAVREAYSDEQARELGLDAEFPPIFATEAAKHGLDDVDARRYWRAHWRLPSPEQAYRMLHRKLISVAQLSQLLKALDYPLVWRDRLRDIAFIVPGRIDLRRMLRAEVLTETEVVAGYERIGYAPADARILTDFAVAERDGTDVGLASVRVYRRRVIQRANAEYVTYQLTPTEVRNALGAIGIPRRHVDLLLPLWDAERSLVRTPLTAAQVRTAFARARLKRADALGRLRERGYSETDALLFLGLAVPGLDAAEIRRAYSRNAITFDQAVAELGERGMTTEQASRYLAETRPEVTARDVKDAFQAETLTEADARARLAELGYDAADIDLLIESWAA